MTFTVDESQCLGCGACEATCPDVFALAEGVSHVKLNPVPGQFREAALAAEDGCPAGAISHTD